jgi:ribonuclease I
MQLSNLIYLLALQKCRNSKDFTIHGLWIDYKSGGFPEYCHDVKFDIDLLEPIRNELDEKWPSCKEYHKSNEYLYKHEFLKHCSCMEHPMKQLDYFNNTLRVFDEEVQKGLHKCKGNKCMIEIDHSRIHNVFNQ